MPEAIRTIRQSRLENCREFLEDIYAELVEMGVGSEDEVSGAGAVDYLNKLRERLENSDALS